MSGGGASSDEIAVNGDGGAPAPPPWSRIRDSSYWAQEIWKRGEPALRPERGRVVLARTASMAIRERQLYGRALFVRIVGDARATPEQLVESLERDCGIPQKAATAQVTAPPFHFLVKFDMLEACTRVVDLYPLVRCGAAQISVRRWSRGVRGAPGQMEYHTKLSFDGLPEEAQEPEALKQVVAGLDGELEEILPATDLWITPLTAWMRNPSDVPKVVSLTVLMPDPVPKDPSSSDEDGESPSSPLSPREKRTMEYNVLVHVKEVIDRGPLMMEDRAFAPDEGEDLSHKHKFMTWRGKIDGTGSGDHGEA